MDLLVHELGHAKLAETLDPIFAAIYLDPEKFDPQKPKDQRLGQIIKVCQDFVDLWVDEEVHKINPELTKQSIKTWGKAANSLIDAGQGQYLLDRGWETIMGYALNYAIIEKTGLIEYRKELYTVFDKIRRLDNKLAKKCQSFASFLQKLPALPSDKDEALDLLEKSAIEVSKRLNLPIEPFLVRDKEKDFIYWSYR